MPLILDVQCQNSSGLPSRNLCNHKTRDTFYFQNVIATHTIILPKYVPKYFSMSPCKCFE